MSLYKQWNDMVLNYIKLHGEAAFWKEYGAAEKKVYSKILSNPNEAVKGSFKAFVEEFQISKEFFMGFLDGINDSIKEPMELEEVNEDSEIVLNIDYEKLYFNMLDAKADYLYKLPQWEDILTAEQRKDIQRQYRDSKIIVNENKVGRNDPCPCGSGKKYKKCCGK